MILATRFATNMGEHHHVSAELGPDPEPTPKSEAPKGHHGGIQILLECLPKPFFGGMLNRCHCDLPI
jgi:hypothetical protein